MGSSAELNMAGPVAAADASEEHQGLVAHLRAGWSMELDPMQGVTGDGNMLDSHNAQQQHHQQSQTRHQHSHLQAQP